MGTRAVLFALRSAGFGREIALVNPGDVIDGYGARQLSNAATDRGGDPPFPCWNVSSVVSQLRSICYPQ